MDNYVLEIYETGSSRDVWISFESSRPFGSIGVGDILNNSMLPDADPKQTILVSKIEHLLLNAGNEVKHKMMVYTSASNGDPEGLRR